MKTIITTAIGFVLCALLMVSCKKEKTKTELISGGTWKITASRISTNGGAWVDLLATSALPCDLDNIFTWNASNMYTNDEGATKCVSTDPQIAEQGAWSFQNNETEIIFPEFSNSSKIQELTENKFVILNTETSGGTTDNLELTFSR